MKTFKIQCLAFVVLLYSCKKDQNPTPNPSPNNFSVTSSAFSAGAQLPKLYSCDSTGTSFPLSWTDAPSGTTNYAIIVSSSANPSKANMVLYNIPASTGNIPAGVSSGGTFGINDYNLLQSYSAPCPTSLTTESYNVVIYALSAQPTITVAQNQVTATILKQAISNITLDTAMISFSYTRSGGSSNPGFTAICPVVGTDSILPVIYTCDGQSYSPPVSWTNAPAGTNSYAVVMNTIILPTQNSPITDMHVYMILYNIPSNLSGIPENVSGIGLFGHNTLNPTLSYSPPCSQGPGFKYYYITAYALSTQPNLPVQSNVTYPVFQDAIRSIVLDSSKITVKYSR